jgi:hypothetical protein
MAKCPFAQWMPLPWNAGHYVAGPFKIVHHTTEGSTAAGAFKTYKQRHDIPHFTVDDHFIYQHLDTDVAATAPRSSGRNRRDKQTFGDPVRAGGFRRETEEQGELEERRPVMPMDRKHPRRAGGVAERLPQSAKERKRPRPSQSQRAELDHQGRALRALPRAGQRPLGSRLHGGRSRTCDERFRRRRTHSGEGRTSRNGGAFHGDARSETRQERSIR